MLVLLWQVPPAHQDSRAPRGQRVQLEQQEVLVPAVSPARQARVAQLARKVSLQLAPMAHRDLLVPQGLVVLLAPPEEQAPEAPLVHRGQLVHRVPSVYRVRPEEVGQRVYRAPSGCKVPPEVKAQLEHRVPLAPSAPQVYRELPVQLERPAPRVPPARLLELLVPPVQQDHPAPPDQPVPLGYHSSAPKVRRVYRVRLVPRDPSV